MLTYINIQIPNLIGSACNREGQNSKQHTDSKVQLHPMCQQCPARALQTTLVVHHSNLDFRLRSVKAAVHWKDQFAAVPAVPGTSFARSIDLTAGTPGDQPLAVHAVHAAPAV